YESYLARSKEATAQESLEMPDSRIVTKASVPIRPSSPKTLLILGLALMLGHGAGSVLAFLADYLDGRVKTLEQAEAISGVPALAAVPSINARELAARARRGHDELARYDRSTMKLLPPALQPPLMRYSIERPGTFFAEAIRSVRLALQRTMRMQPVKVILVSSALDSEGKTTLAGNLAQSLATLGIRTLLIDGGALAELADRIILALAWDQTPGEVLSHTINLLSPVSDRILGTVLTQVDLSRLQFYDYYRSSAYLKPYGVANLSPGAAK